MSAKTGRKGKRDKRRTVDSWKTKEWFEVYAPRSFKEVFIGQIPSGSPDSVQGRIVDLLLSEVTGKIQHQHIKARFKITSMNANRCQTRYYGHEYTRDTIRSMVNRGTSCIMCIFNFTTADDFRYRVSTMVVTRKRAKNSQQKTIRKIVFDVINEFSKHTKHEMFIKGVLFGKYAENVRKIAQTIYPLRKCEIFKTKVISFPEGVEDVEMGEDDQEDIELEMREHGKSIKAKKQRRHKEEKDSEDEPNEQDEILIKEIEEEEKRELTKL